jgi:nucleoside-diphosphate-sugar epimerase
MPRVLLTGASGFLGVHTTARLLEDGHTVRALVRTPERLRENLRPLGVDVDDARIEVCTGDMTDSSAVREAVTSCDLAVHAAATFSYRRRDEQAIREENVRGTTTVLDAAIEAGCQGIVHVSSTVALLRKGAVLDHRSPLGSGIGPYTTSKVESERVARERQDAGAPVAIVNPGGILGPHDAYLGESNTVIREVLRGRLPTWPRGGLQWVDVRDTAAVVAGALQRPGRRYLVPGENLGPPHALLSELTGRRLPLVVLPMSVVVPMVLPGYLTGWSFLPGALEGARLLALDTTADASATVTDLGIEGRPLRESVSDTIRWMVEAGHLSRKQAGAVLA